MHIKADSEKGFFKEYLFMNVYLKYRHAGDHTDIAVYDTLIPIILQDSLWFTASSFCDISDNFLWEEKWGSIASTKVLKKPKPIIKIL